MLRLFTVSSQAFQRAVQRLMPHCSQTFPCSLLNPIFTSVFFRCWGSVFFFLSFWSSERNQREIRSQRERWLNSVFSLWRSALPFIFENHRHSPLMNASLLFWLAGRLGRVLPCCLKTLEWAETARGGRSGCPVVALNDTAAHRSGSPCPLWC